MRPYVEKNIFAGFLCAFIVLITIGLLFFKKTGFIAEAMIIFAAVSAIIMLYLFYAINLTLKNQHTLEEEIQRLKSKIGERTLKEIENEKIYRSLAANIPGSAITILDREERYLLAEGDMLANMGYDKNVMPGRKISDVITPENYSWYKVLIDEAFQGKTLLRERKHCQALMH